MLLMICAVECSNEINDDKDINVYDYYSGEQREETTHDERIYLFMTMYNVPEGTKIKGAMLISPEGAFLF